MPPSDDPKLAISREDLLKYIEIDLWSRFQVRLWTLLGAFLTIVSLASLLGVPYYIRSEINERLAEQKTAFESRSSEILTYAKLLNVLSVRFGVAQAEIELRIADLTGGIRQYAREHRSSPHEASLKTLISGLDLLASRTRFTVAEDLVVAPAAVAGLQVLSPQFLVSRSPIGGSSAATHPVRDGTIRGALRDLRFRIVEFELYRQALDQAWIEFSQLGGAANASESEKRQDAVAVDSLYDQVFSARYQTLRKGAGPAKLLNPTELESYKEYAELYSLDPRASSSAP